MRDFYRYFDGQLPALVMFDLDGTLVDSVPDLAVATDAMLQECGYPTAGEARVRLWVGNGAEMLVRRALAHAEGASESQLPVAAVREALPVFLRHYQACSGRHARLYPGVTETLQWLQAQGCNQALVTNKPARFVPHLLQQLGIADHFELWLGGDSLPQKKPHPAPLQHLLAAAEVAPQRALMVGDSRTDIETARAAGVPVLAVSYGYNHGRPVAEEQPDWLTDNLADFFLCSQAEL